MSFHRTPKYQIPALIEALKAHGLEHDKPSQLADAFRIGWMAAQPDKATIIAAHEALQAGQESTLVQYRMAANWNEPRRWTDWDDCSPEAAADYERIKVLHDWEYQVRRLYAAPQPVPDKDAEIAALKADRDNWKEICVMYNTKYSEGTVEIAALRKDAERYRWLRSDDIEVMPGQREICVIQEHLPHTEDADVTLIESALDAAIDAAIAQAVQP